ncbi:MAG: hypothetical protein JW940_05355 [Polyangiaceae bacterium]|nr:hypothetical protein [Polyangiaceae bacterium]
MPKTRLIRLGACVATLFSIVHCGSGEAPSLAGVGGSSSHDGGSSSGGASGASSSTGSTSSTGGKTSAGGSNSTGGKTSSGATGGDVSPSGGRSTTTGGTHSGGGTSTTGGTSSAGGGPTGGTRPTGGGSSTTGGTRPTGGSTSTGGTPSGGGTSTGGQGNTGGETATGGTSEPRKDAGGKELASPGDKTSTPSDYLNLGDIRLLANRWGSDELGCGGTQLEVFVNTDKSIGWSINRGVCDTTGKDGLSSGEHPDYPEVEFGIHPFGIGNSLATSPDFSSTTLLPRQVKDITSATVKVDNMSFALQGQQSWNMNFEFWLSQNDPTTANSGVYAELIAFWGWQAGRWPCDETLGGRTASSGGKTYKLCHQSDQWADGKWRYFQFWDQGGPSTNFSGTVDVKALLDWLVSNYGYSKDLWLTRIEVGTEIDDNTGGTVNIKNIAFEVNGTSKTLELAP